MTMNESSTRRIEAEEAHQARIFDAWAERDFLQSTIDPHDTKGLKCDYIDRWSRYYIRKHIMNVGPRRVAEVGCGSGRNLFSVAKDLEWGYGIDISPRQIENARLAQHRLGVENLSFYSRPAEFLAEHQEVETLFTMWVVAGFESDDNLIQVIRSYRDGTRGLRRFVFFEQVVTKTHTIALDGAFFKKVRTRDDFILIFRRAGLRPISFHVCNEKGFGPLYRIAYNSPAYKHWPRWLNLNGTMLRVDRMLVRRQVAPRPTEAVFICELDG
jgi:SAM-dependent methyltransferase